MGFTQAISSVLGKYATFEGRAPRSEYWWWALFTILLNWVLGLADLALFGAFSFIATGDVHMFTPLTTLVGVLLILPSIAVGARRFHDMDRTGWWLLIGLTGIGAVVIFFWFMFKGTEGPNRFGPDPLARY
ncbi:uncharacterized membrane protein YhaH (DUF805 family) [Ancylobacter sp. 3268]|uniref:DUF805 domain-containing protein n=1 Tax=Ancylobacter sp. 3268 TaxID=2817752 RepID=UPI00285B264F|nr:DUF805 domain-containing protein [Ancylobacter sp. 3268]MDR6951769.1 uncharacterized membrane protein YhaH (DUF805 family) [Ancylobacter sp. 3268]